MYIDAAVDRCDLIVAAWGTRVAADQLADSVLRRLALLSRVPRCLGVTKDGHPRHPLYVHGERDLEWMPVR